MLSDEPAPEPAAAVAHPPLAVLADAQDYGSMLAVAAADEAPLAFAAPPQSLKIADLLQGNYNLLVARVVRVGALMGQKSVKARRIMFILAFGEELSLALFGAQAHSTTLFDIGSYYTITFVVSVVGNPNFKMTDTAYELRVGKTSVITRIETPASAYPTLPQSSLPTTMLAGLRATPLGARLDCRVLLLAASKHSTALVLNYLKHGFLPTELQFYVVDSSNTIAKLTYTNKSGAHGIAEMLMLFADHYRIDVSSRTERLVLFLHSVSHGNANGKPLLEVLDMSSIYKLPDAHPLHAQPTTGLQSLTGAQDPDMPNAIRTMLMK
jgi:hypothetical protein